jgi:hypothetical protein
MAIWTTSVFTAYRQAGCQLSKEKGITGIITENYKI